MKEVIYLLIIILCLIYAAVSEPPVRRDKDNDREIWS